MGTWGVSCCLDALGIRLRPNVGQRQLFDDDLPPSVGEDVIVLTHLVNHVGKQTLDLVVVDCLLAPEADCCGKLRNGHPSATNRLLTL